MPGTDLFGNWIARVAFGRTKRKGRTTLREFASDELVRAFGRGLRSRRAAIR